MDKKRLVNLIATAIVLNNLSSTVVLGNDINSTSYLQSKAIKNSKDTKSNKSFLNDIEEDNTISIEDYNTLLKERIVYNENEFVSIISNSKINNIKLACDLDLAKLKSEDVIVKNDHLVIDGNGYSLNLPKSNRTNSEAFFTLDGENITLKNIRFKIDEEYNKLLDGAIDGITVLGNNNCLHNVEIEGCYKNAVKISECQGITIEDVIITGEEKKGVGIAIDNSTVLCKGITIDGTKIGIDIIGGKSELTVEDNLDINSTFNIKSHSKVGAAVVSEEGKLVEKEKVFGFTYYNVVKNEEKVKDRNDFLKLANNPIINKVTLDGNIDLKGYEQAYNTMLENGVYIDANEYHLVL